MDVPRFLKKPEGHFFLLGPRGTGKSWWTRKVFSDALRVDLLDAATLRELAARPERLRDMVHGAGDCDTVVVDEVQKLPELLEVVHGLIEEKSGKVFVLTGSSARKLRRAGVNLLGGRAGRLSMHPYMAAELGEDFSLELALRHGLLPVVVGASDPDFQMQAYCGLYLKEEVQAEGFVRNVMEIWNKCHAMVLPSRGEGTPLAVLEAMMCGRLAVTTDVGGNSEILEDGVTGWIAETAAPLSFGNAMERAWQARSHWEKMGIVAHEKAKKLNNNRPAEKLLEVIQEAKIFYTQP